MFTSERQKKIEDYVLERGSATVQELVERFGVSSVTIRKDLSELETGGTLQRTHGGAVSRYKSAQEERFQTLTDRCREEKRAIGMKALSYVENGDTILLDASTTGHVFAELLVDSGINGLTVITPSVYAAQTLLLSGIRVILIGGVVNQNIGSSQGPYTVNQIRRLNADKGFIGVNGIDRQFGFSVDSLEEAAVKRSICACARSTFILADYTKFNRRYMAQVSAPGEGVARYLITDRQRDNIDYSFLKQELKLVFAQ